jgi:hypothetical protein
MSKIWNTDFRRLVDNPNKSWIHPHREEQAVRLVENRKLADGDFG